MKEMLIGVGYAAVLIVVALDVLTNWPTSAHRVALQMDALTMLVLMLLSRSLRP